MPPAIPDEIQHAIVTLLVRAGRECAARPVCRTWRAFVREVPRDGDWHTRVFEDNAEGWAWGGWERPEHGDADRALAAFVLGTARGAPWDRATVESLYPHLTRALCAGHLGEVRDAIATVGAGAGDFGCGLVRAAAFSGRRDALEWALGAWGDAPPKAVTVHAFRGACEGGARPLAEWLLGRHPSHDLDAEGDYYALRVAASLAGHPDVVRWLLETADDTMHRESAVLAGLAMMLAAPAAAYRPGVAEVFVEALSLADDMDNLVEVVLRTYHVRCARKRLRQLLPPKAHAAVVGMRALLRLERLDISSVVDERCMNRRYWGDEPDPTMRIWWDVYSNENDFRTATGVPGRYEDFGEGEKPLPAALYVHASDYADPTWWVDEA